MPDASYILTASIVDLAGNSSAASSEFPFVVETIRPSVDIQGERATANSLAPFPVTFEFSENVSGFAAGDVTLSNASLSNFAAVDGDTYTADVTPTGAGDITIDVAAGVSKDAAGNDNTAATQATTIYDATAPGVDIQDEPLAVNSTAAFAVTFEFSEDVTGFDATDVNLVNSTLSNFSATDGNTYTADVTPTGVGHISIDLPPAVAQDVASNDNMAAAQATVIYDATAPSVDIQNEPAIVNSTAVFNVTFEFSENVSGFDASDVALSNATLSNFVAVDSDTYTADVIPSGAGDITIDVAAGAGQDQAANGNTAATQAAVVYDAVAPSLDIQGEPSIVNSTADFSITFEFSEDVSGISSGDVTLANASLSNFVATDANTYTADITPDGTGDITIDVAGGVAQDAAGNDNTAAAQALTQYDAVAPSVDIQGEPGIVNSNAAFPVTFQFSEGISGFDASDVILANASLSNFLALDTNTYTADITPNGGGDITIDIAAAVAQDAAANANTAAPQASVQYDATAPSVDIQSQPAIVNSTAPYSVTIQFSEGVSGFSVADVTLANASVSGFTVVDASEYTAEITPDGNGDITINVAAGVAQDPAGNDNTAATQAVTTYDATAPSVDIQGEPGIVNTTAPYAVTFAFSEDVSGFAAGDISLANASLSNFVSTNASTHTADITPDGSGDVTIDVAAAVAQDAANNDNTSAIQAVTVYDATAPGVAIQGTPSIVNSTSAFSATFQFDEDVSGFTAGDVTLGNASISNFVAVDANSYTADISPDGSGDVTIDVAAAVAQDAAGNDNTAATQVVTVYDAVAPSVDIQGAPSIVNSTASFTVVFQFSEDVTGFTAADITLANASISNVVATNASTYTADVTPDGSGDISIDVAAAVAQDNAGNDNSAATQAVTVYDATSPSVDIQGEPAFATSTTAFSVTFEFSEDVTGFSAVDVSLANASIANFSVTDANTYIADITPDGTGGRYDRCCDCCGTGCCGK